MIRRKPEQKKESRRRISCKDLGNGECEGWMWHQKERTGLGPKSWKKYWFKLKDNDLYCYKDPQDVVARRLFHMPGFLVSVATEASKKYAFKISNTAFGTVFFGTKDYTDLSKWVTKLQLSSLLQNVSMEDKSKKSETELKHVSESENEDETEDEDKASVCKPKDIEEKFSHCIQSTEVRLTDASSLEEESTFVTSSGISSSTEPTIDEAAFATVTAEATSEKSERASLLGTVAGTGLATTPKQPKKHGPPTLTKQMSGTGSSTTCNLKPAPKPPTYTAETLLHEKTPARPATLPKKRRSVNSGNLSNDTMSKESQLMHLQPDKPNSDPSTTLPSESEKTPLQKASVINSSSSESLVLPVTLKLRSSSALSSDTEVALPTESAIAPSVRTKLGPPILRKPSPKKEMCSNLSSASSNFDLGMDTDSQPGPVLHLPFAVSANSGEEFESKDDKSFKRPSELKILQEPSSTEIQDEEISKNSLESVKSVYLPEEQPEKINANHRYEECCSRLNSLQQSFKKKVWELQTINELLSLSLITSDAVNQFCKEHKDILYGPSSETAQENF